jgi:hypothetical protein
MKKQLLTLLALCLLATSCNGVTRTVRVTVTGEDGTPIKDADVGVYFLGYDLDKDKEVAGLTNDLGVFSATDKAVLRMETSIAKDGYYKTHSGRLSRTQDHDVTFVLREKRNPIPLYAKREIITFPINREWLGYDFQAGDWTAPHGEGKTIDLWLKCDTEKVNSGSYRDAKGSLEIKFKEDEGLLLVEDDYLPLSIMKMPHLAPQTGYQNTFRRFEESFRNKEFRRNTGYFFRTRVRKEGKHIVSAHYGKLLEDIRFDPRDMSRKGKPKEFGTTVFTYYFNPTPNDRNLEFDPKRNLLTNLEYEERANQP